MALESFILPALMRSPAALTASYLRELQRDAHADAALHAAGIDPVRLQQDSRYRVPLYQAYALLAATISISGDPLLALRQARDLSLRAFPLLGMGLLASTTLEEGLQRLIELDPLIWDAATITLSTPDDDQGEAALIMSPHLPMPPAVTELALAGWVLLGPALWQIDACQHRLSFRHAARAPEADYQALFGCPVSFGADRDAVFFPAAWLAHRLRFTDPGGGNMILQEARRLLAQPLQLNLENHLRAICFQALPGALPEAPALAERLGIPPRQLRQLMSEQNLRLRDLQDGVRREAALRWIDQREIDISDMAQACGFSEQSAFQRAFRRWTGETPGQWRQRDRKGLSIDPFFV